MVLTPGVLQLKEAAVVPCPLMGPDDQV